MWSCENGSQVEEISDQRKCDLAVICLPTLHPHRSLALLFQTIGETRRWSGRFLSPSRHNPIGTKWKYSVKNTPAYDNYDDFHNPKRSLCGLGRRRRCNNRFSRVMEEGKEGRKERKRRAEGRKSGCAVRTSLAGQRKMSVRPSVRSQECGTFKKFFRATQSERCKTEGERMGEIWDGQHVTAVMKMRHC